MGKGRKPCCDKAGVKKGPWSQGEDLKLISFIQKHGHSNWRALPKLAGLARCGKSCRLRWVNYLRPDLKRGDFTPQEEEAIIKLHQELGNKWSKIASKFSGRTDNEIKNVWNTHLKKRLKAKESKKNSQESYSSIPTSTSTDEPCVESSKNTTEHSSSSSTSYTSNPPFSEQVIENPVPMLDNNSLDELIEIPFDPDIDIWELLDGDQPNSANLSDVNFNEGDNSINIVQEIDNLSNNNNNVNNNNNNAENGENWWWLVYLENELGLNQDETNITTKSNIVAI